MASLKHLPGWTSLTDRPISYTFGEEKRSIQLDKLSMYQTVDSNPQE